MVETLKDLLIDVIIEKEKSGYIIGKFGKSKPNLGDRHSKMETTHKLILCYAFSSNEMKLDMSTHPSNIYSLYKNFFFAKNVGW